MADDTLTIVTGASSNHFSCLCNLLTSLDRYEDARVLVYDLGLTEQEAGRLRTEGRSLRTFPFDQYPPHFGIKADFDFPYAWKPLIVHDVFMEAGHPVLWLDAGDLVHERLDRIREELRTVGLYTPGSVGTIADWTHPLTVERLGGGTEILGDRNRAGGTVGFGTNDLAREIVTAWRDAAMSKEIFWPEGWSRKVHRCDQAVLSVLVALARRRRPLTLANEYFGVSIQHDEATPEQAARFMAMTSQQVRQEKRMIARAGQPAQRPPVPRNPKRRRGVARLWRKLKKRIRQAGE